MAFCVQCGAQLEERQKFCPSCGAPQTAQQPNVDPAADIANNKGISILCYFGIFLLIPLLTQPNSPFVKYHSNQGLVLLLLCIALSIVSVIPILGWIVGAAGSVFAVVCFIMGLINVLNGETKPLPLIGGIEILH